MGPSITKVLVESVVTSTSCTAAGVAFGREASKRKVVVVPPVDSPKVAVDGAPELTPAEELLDIAVDEEPL